SSSTTAWASARWCWDTRILQSTTPSALSSRTASRFRSCTRSRYSRPSACALVPHAESVRFSKTGCDVASAAVRLARAFTGRDKVLCCGYHGWHDWYISVTDRAAGIPGAVAELTGTFGYNDIASVAAALDDDTACVILEPMTFEAPRADFLIEVRRLCDARGALLIFDEMWTGFRMAPGGAQEHFGVRAD